MTMTAAGAAKLIEEVGELQSELGQLQQILAKKFQYWYVDEHPDGKGPISERIENEMGDVFAAMYFVIEQLELDRAAIIQRRRAKGQLFETWQAQIDNNDQGIDSRPAVPPHEVVH